MSREIDVEVAENVMGWGLVHIPADGKFVFDAFDNWCEDNGKGRGMYTPQEWNPSESIADAWKVVEKMYQSGWKLELFVGLGLIDARFWRNGTSHEGRAPNELSAPMAICLAAIQSLRTP